MEEPDIEEALSSVKDEETELDKVMALMLDPNNIEHNTQLTRNEIKAFSALFSLEKEYNLPSLKIWLMKHLTLSVSRDRAGRKEWVKIIGSARGRQEEEDEEERKGIRWFRR